jgi:CRISPR-associated protein Cas5d
MPVIVTADTACFTRAEFPSERVSYQVPTPSALVGALSAVFWKPQRCLQLGAGEAAAQG